MGEGGGTATITVERVGDKSRPASIGFATSDGTASVSSDYSPASGSLSFAIGDTSKTGDRRRCRLAVDELERRNLPPDADLGRVLHGGYLAFEFYHHVPFCSSGVGLATA